MCYLNSNVDRDGLEPPNNFSFICSKTTSAICLGLGLHVYLTLCLCFGHPSHRYLTRLLEI